MPNANCAASAATATIASAIWIAMPYERGRGAKCSHAIQSWTRNAHGHVSGTLVHLNRTYGKVLAAIAEQASNTKPP
jgi:hypothetical protein